MNEKGVIIPKGFFSQLTNVITTKEALKDVIPVNWENALKNRKKDNGQIIKLAQKSKKANTK